MAHKLALCAIQVITVMALFAVRSATAVAGDNGDNTLEFNALCRLLRAAVAGLQQPTTELPESIRKSFNSISMAAKLAYENATQMEAEFKTVEPDTTKWPKYLSPTPAGLHAQRAINATYAVAKKLKQKAEEALTKRKADIEAANKLLAAAATGESKLPTNYDDKGDFLPSTDNSPVFGPSATKTKNCGGTGAGDGKNGENAGVSLVNDIICLCCITDGGNKKLCGNVAGSIDQAGVNYNNPKTSFKTAFAAVMAICTKRADKTTSLELELYLASFDSFIGRQTSSATTLDEAGQYILGYANSHSTGCTGAGSQTCVNYMAQLKADTGTGIPWRSKIVAAISKAQETAAVASEVAQAETTLEHINTTIWQAYAAGFVAELGSGQQSGKPATLLDPKKAEECKQHKPKKTCEENGCQWKGTSDTEGACQAKPGSETTAAGSGEGPTATPTGCARHQNQPDCERDKTGDKQNCAWRKGKDGETDEPEKEKCRNGSFLANKQFALSMVSGAFGGHTFLSSPSIFLKTLLKFLLLENF
ncbi:Trypanosomal VSG domain/Trypanosome variant surface glycoprotein C-terminal domain containing protein, putative [Trypanosoma equiperdum]|uniref:Trypanosomal VSG domain/Trypanosome variant surface glycoprotein C-terminal domain containing protein, putative n=1 Tax=Trypanosoma equiperdum TaxID=5694 RepID=A0A1G4I6L4_TRYEQ|nr:Trypanosomal VSG domain/Trypanosome variant surface glycoprotein C-terminal domain containing protein, putative [Trypanosoma equiperdum]